MGASIDKMIPRAPQKVKILIRILILFFPIVTFYQIINAQDPSQQESDQAKLAAILEKGKTYCEKLVKSSLNFVCLEEITETVLQPQVITDYADNPDSRDFRAQARTVMRKKTRKYTYDYQLIRKEGKIEETRTLLEEDGEKTNVTNAELKTMTVRYAKMIFGPMLLNEHWQKYYGYMIVGEEEIFGENSIIIEAKPKKTTAGLYLYGKIWINENDFGVLKIEWAQESIGLYRDFEQRAKRKNAKPLITSVTEYGVEKNGIRFPSRFEYERALIKKNGKKHVVSETIVRYKNYKFFTVEIDVDFSNNL
jgi:hypothetical protein